MGSKGNTADQRMKRTMSIGELAGKVGVTPRTIRWYEQQGLLRNHRRARYTPRRYSGEDYYRMWLIRRARTLGLPLLEIKGLIDAYRQDPTEKKIIEESIQILQANVAKLDGKISEATEARALLASEIERLKVLLKTKLDLRRKLSSQQGRGKIGDASRSPLPTEG